MGVGHTLFELMMGGIMNLNTISQIVFYVGISVGIVCASKLPVDGTTYPDTLIPFLVSVFVSILGLVGWRRTSVSSKADESANAPDNPQNCWRI